MLSTSDLLPAELTQTLAARDAQGALRATMAHFQCQAGTVHFLSPGGHGILTLAAHEGIPPQVVGLIGAVPIGKGIAGLAAERRTAITICNLQTDDSGQARPAAKNTGMEGSIAVPILDAGGELRGVLGIAKATAHDWTPAQSEELQGIANRFASLVG
jgi:putative methionine-R-sulfoxide reductase with GAF domain